MSAKYLLAFAALVVIAGCAAGVPLARQDQQDPGLLVFNGYTSPKIDCYRCHNGDGHGTGHGPDLAKAVPKLDDVQLAHVIDHGALFMPAYAGMMNDQERQELVAWLRKEFGGPPARADVR